MVAPVNFFQWLEAARPWEAALEGITGYDQIVAVLEQQGAEFHDVRRLKTPVLVFEINSETYVIEDFDYPEPMEASEWVTEKSYKGQIHLFLPDRDFNATFWRQAANYSRLYHGTSTENWQQIQQSGVLSPKCRTRGISNRGVSCAIFTSTEYETASQSYPIVLEINIGQMKTTGFRPEVSQEPDVEKGEAAQSLAHAIGLEAFDVDIEGGMDPETIIIYAPIPIKYVKAV